jgi:hypothetical protein
VRLDIIGYPRTRVLDYKDGYQEVSLEIDGYLALRKVGGDRWVNA